MESRSFRWAACKHNQLFMLRCPIVTYRVCGRSHVPIFLRTNLAHVASLRVCAAPPCGDALPAYVRLSLPAPQRLRVATVLSSHVRLLRLAPPQILLFSCGLLLCRPSLCGFLLRCFLFASFLLRSLLLSYFPLGGLLLGRFFLASLLLASFFPSSLSLSYFFLCRLLFAGFFLRSFLLSYFSFCYFFLSGLLLSCLLLSCYAFLRSLFSTCRLLFRSLLFRFRHNKSPP